MRRLSLVHLHEAEPATAAGDTASTRVLFDAEHGCAHLCQRVIAFAPGRSKPRSPGDCEETLFVLDGAGALVLEGVRHELEPETGAYVKPGETYEIESPGPGELVVHSVTVPAPATGVATGERRVTVRLAEQDARDATGSRHFRLVIDPHTGCPSATQFVGYIPPGRAPDHFHTYDEVIYVLEGDGMVHIGDLHEPLSRGSCVHLTPRLVHSVENRGDSEMRVLGIFRPAGSPAEAYYPDGTLAYFEPSS